MKTIKQLRDELTAARPAMKADDHTFFDQADDDLYNAKHPADYRRLRNRLVEHCKALLDKGGSEEVADGYYKMIDIADIMIAAKIDGNKAAGMSAVGASGWVNPETGNSVHLLAPNEKVSDALPPQAREDNALIRQGVGVGQMLNAMLTGRGSPEIRAALSEGTDSAGGYGIPTEVLGPFIDRLRTATRFIQAGGKTLLLEGMRTRIVRLDTDPSPTWRAENAAVGESAPTFSALDFLPKSLAVLVKVSMELLQDSVNAPDALEKALVGSLSVELDRACFFGAGTATEPLGIANTSGINTVSMGTNGASLSDFDPFVDAMYETEVANSAITTAAVMHPRSMKSIRKMKDSMGQPLRQPPGVDSLPMLSTTSFPIAQTVGTSEDCSTILQGDFGQAILGLRQQLTILRLDQRFVDNLQVGFIAFLRADVGVAHPASFCAIEGVRG